VRYNEGLRIFAAASVSVAIACDASRPPMNAADAIEAQRLAGMWEVRFQLIRSPMIALDSAVVPTGIQGTLSLLVNTSLNRTFPRMGIPTDYGSYDVDLTPYGFDTRVSGKTPTAVAGRLEGDSVEIILGPESEAGELVMIGRLQHGAVAGRWRVFLPTTGGEGTFEMKRGAAASTR
jgi:hypothetical protein